MKNSEWHPIPGYGDKYLVRRDGTVKNGKTGKVLTPVKKDGYLVVRLIHQNKTKSVKVHRLVAEAFIPNPDNLPVVNHIDGNKANPQFENLEWVSFSENAKHAYRLGLNGVSEKRRRAAASVGADNGRKSGKAVLQMDRSRKVIQRYPSIQEAERRTGIRRQNITRACKQENFQAGGYKWEKV